MMRSIILKELYQEHLKEAGQHPCHTHRYMITLRLTNYLKKTFMAISYFLQFKKWRVWLAWLCGIALFLNSKTDDQSFRVGTLILMAGEFIRIWSAGFIEIKGRKLATAGPFAHVRNPLYLGNFLIGMGLVWISKNILNMTIYLAGFGILYWGTIKKEETELKERFGEAYLNYLKNVPSFFPRITPYSSREKTSFRWRLLGKHREHITLLGLTFVVVSLYLWEEIVLEKQFHWKEKIALGTALTLLVVLLADRIYRLYRTHLVKSPVPNLPPPSSI